MKNPLIDRALVFVLVVLCCCNANAEMVKKATLSKDSPREQRWELAFFPSALKACDPSAASAGAGTPKEKKEFSAVENWLRSEGFSLQPLPSYQADDGCVRRLSFTGSQTQIHHAFGDGATAIPERFQKIIRSVNPVVIAVKKPVIYLYPAHTMRVSVHLNYDGFLTVTYPPYHKGWNVTAYPDGTLRNDEDGNDYAYLFWEGRSLARDLEFNDGFVVKNSDSVRFLKEKLSLLGLTPKEYNDFIVFWLPELLKSPYNLIHFSGEDYRNKARLSVSPQPDSQIRVFMLFRKLDGPQSFPGQSLARATRKGFSVVEWGGAEVP